MHALCQFVGKYVCDVVTMLACIIEVRHGITSILKICLLRMPGKNLLYPTYDPIT